MGGVSHLQRHVYKKTFPLTNRNGATGGQEAFARMSIATIRLRSAGSRDRCRSAPTSLRPGSIIAASSDWR
ncbi:hypothetical protein TAL182_PE00375 (plasmid) [Rhizobium sp. TAL182]|nr:hypothetical protein TAL182_PE00375 [Rhizobium sp. TAL182]